MKEVGIVTEDAPVVRRPSWLRRTWNKYALIIVGNIVFFALMYWFTYRPHNAESRGGEFLSLAQQQETDGRLQAAEVLYGKVVQDYGETKAGVVAMRRLPEVRAASEKATHAAAAEQLPPELELAKMLKAPPAWFMARLLAGQHAKVAKVDRPRYFEALDGYLRIAFERGEIDHGRVHKEAAFAHEALRARYLGLHANCAVEADWMYDDVRIRNNNLFAWSKAVIEVEVRQGDNVEKDSQRFDSVRPGQELAIAELRISSDGGPVHCKVRVVSEQGEVRFEQRL